MNINLRKDNEFIPYNKYDANFIVGIYRGKELTVKDIKLMNAKEYSEFIFALSQYNINCGHLVPHFN